jgi:hypothetical protein
MACHTRPGGQPFEGGLAIDTPFGTLYTPNITPAKDAGIGDFSDADFVRALHDGIAPNGKPYYPALPYPSYTKVAKDDLLAIKDYLFTLEPSQYQPPKNALRWPFDERDLLFGWQELYLKRGRFQPNADKSEAWNRGAYLVEGLGHCGACHTPRNLAGATKSKEAIDRRPDRRLVCPEFDIGPVRRTGKMERRRTRDLSGQRAGPADHKRRRPTDRRFGADGRGGTRQLVQAGQF